MSPYPAVRRNGICTGSLWKSHSRAPSSSSSPIPASSNKDADARGGDDAAATRQASATAAALMDGLLAEFNERQRAHEFCVLVGNVLRSYSDAWAYGKGDHPTSEIRIVGASAWNPLSGTPMKSSSSPATTTLASETHARAAGASPGGAGGGGNPSSSSKTVDFLIVTCVGTRVQCSAPTPADRDEWLAALNGGLEGSFPESRVETLRVLSRRDGETSGDSGDTSNTDDGMPGPVENGDGNYTTHNSAADAMVRSTIASAAAAFEAESSSPLLVPPPPQIEARNAQLARRKRRSAFSVSSAFSGVSASSDSEQQYCYGTGGGGDSSHPPTTGYRSPCDDRSAPPSETHCTSCGKYPPVHAIRIDAAPLPDYGMEVRVDLCQNCWIAQGVLGHVRYLGALYETEARGRAAIRIGWEEVVGALDLWTTKEEAPTSAVTSTAEDSSSALAAGAMLEEWTNPRTRAERNGGAVIASGGPSVVTPRSERLEDAESKETPENTSYPAHPPCSKKIISLSPTQRMPVIDAVLNVIRTPKNVVLNVIRTPKFVRCRRQSSVLDSLCRVLEARGQGCVAEFVETLEECARASNSRSCLYAEGEENEDEGVRRKIGMKKEAFKVAGDMGAALKLLYDYALPPDGGRRAGPPPSSRDTLVSVSRVSGNADMLAAILEFFLDLCDEGELEAVAFFWPQLCHIHIQMLPPRDTEELVRVELMEDFLLTVGTRHSVHLALNLVWGLIADLEETLNPEVVTCSAASRRRRFAVLRFVSEIESLLFDFDGGWGGGGASLHGMLVPSQHQSVLLRDAMSMLQVHRRFGAHYLTRSVRLEKLRAEALETAGAEYPSSIDGSAKVRAQIAKNAAYFSSHVAFARKLGDIAEKLRFTPPWKRAETLCQDLKEVNSSGKKLGGDPLNRLCINGRLGHAVHVPANEGHVFRSKERTPVLLLVELVMDEPDEEDEEASDGDANGDGDGDGDGDASYGEAVISVEISEDAGEKGSTGHERAMEVRDDKESVTVEAPMSGAIDDPADSLQGPDAPISKDDYVHNEGLISSNGTNTSRPSTPTSPVRKFTDSSGTSVENFGIPAHGVLAITPRASEANHVTQEGKEMMADMIANLIENQQSTMKLPVPNGEGLRERSIESGDGTGEPSLSKVDSKDNACEVDAAIAAAAAIAGAAVSRPVTKISSNSLASSEALVRRSLLSSATRKPDDCGRKISTLGSIFPHAERGEAARSETPGKPGIHLTADGQFRRDVLFAIMERGMRGNTIMTRGAGLAARRAVQAMDRKRAIALMNDSSNLESDKQKRNEIGGVDCLEMDDGSIPMSLPKLNKNNSGIIISASIDENETMEALRLLIIQNRVAQLNLSSENAVKRGLMDSDDNPEAVDENGKHFEMVDAGEVDSRLAGCGRIASSVLSALRLWKGGIVSNGELLELVQKDLQFIKQSAVFGSAVDSKLIEDSAFWGRFSFGERWAEKKARLSASSPHGSLPGWDLVGCIVKSNDDLRQEAFVMQLIELCAEAFQMAGLDLYVHPYRIIATGRSTGIIECVRNAMSFDSLKKRPGYGTEGLNGHFKRMTEIAADPDGALYEAKKNFVSSLAAYSLMSYLFLFKDRHNGNLLLDTAGHVVHIDFGFVFGIAPGGSFSLEQSTPFKITDEMLEVMGGLGSPLFSEFVTQFCCGFLALQAHADTFLTVVEITSKGSTFNCFEGKESSEIVLKLRERFCPELSKAETVVYALDLIKFATTSYGTKQYDYFQYLSQGIAT